MAPRLRKPSGIPNWPMILLEGPEHVGKSYQAAQFTGCDKVGQAYWMSFGEGEADEYINVPGADYMILDHDGTWSDICNQIREATTAAAGSEKPAVLVIDSASSVWDMLKSWTDNRARNSKKGKQALAADPDAEVTIPPNLWNDANARHHEFLTLLTRFPGIVVLTARGKETMAVDKEGRPVTGQRSYSVEANKSLPFRVNAHVRLSREDPPMVVSFRSATNGMRPGVDKPQRYPDFTLEHLVFVEMGLKDAQTRAVTELVTDESALADAARTELGEFIRAHKLKYKPIAEAFYEAREEKLEETRDPEAIRRLLAALREQYGEPGQGGGNEQGEDAEPSSGVSSLARPVDQADSEKSLEDTCVVLGLNFDTIKGRFIAEYGKPPRQADPTVVQKFCDQLLQAAEQLP